MLQSGNLTFAGSLVTPFRPEALRADERGYLYHPSPMIENNDRGRRGRKQSNPPSFPAKAILHDSEGIVERQREGGLSLGGGAYSLIKSELALAKLGASLELDESTSTGRYCFEGRVYEINKLDEGDVLRGIGWV